MGFQNWETKQTEANPLFLLGNEGNLITEAKGPSMKYLIQDRISLGKIQEQSSYLEPIYAPLHNNRIQASFQLCQCLPFPETPDRCFNCLEDVATSF